MLWVARHLGTDTEPPTPGAQLWAAFAKEHPDRFIMAIIQMGTQEAKAVNRKEATEEARGQPGDRPESVRPEKRSAGATGAASIVATRRQLTTLTLPKDRFINMLRNQRATVPSDSEVVSVVDKPERVVFTLFSKSFPPVAEGQPVPELQPKYGSL